MQMWINDKTTCVMFRACFCRAQQFVSEWPTAGYCGCQLYTILAKERNLYNPNTSHNASKNSSLCECFSLWKGCCYAIACEQLLTLLCCIRVTSKNQVPEFRVSVFSRKYHLLLVSWNRFSSFKRLKWVFGSIAIQKHGWIS